MIPAYAFFLNFTLSWHVSFFFVDHSVDAAENPGFHTES